MTGGSERTGDAAAWRQYWGQGGGRDAVSGGLAGEALATIWRERLAALHRTPRRIIDVACGLGPAAKAARAAFGAAPWIVTCDIAAEGAKRAGEAAQAMPVAADGGMLPFGEEGFDLVISQFGVEYAGERAFAEAGRILRPDGSALIVAHLKGGAIHAESEVNRQALEALYKAGVLNAVREAVQAGRGRDLAAEDRIRPVAEVANANPGAAASRFLAATVPDLARLAANPGGFARHEALAYLDSQEQAIGAYRARMVSMTKAALDRPQVDQALNALAGAGMKARAEVLSGPKGDYGWLMLAGSAA